MMFLVLLLRHVRHATTAMRMPAMSPTMTEGGIAGWKKNEGDTFAAGDVLLEIVCSPFPLSEVELTMG